MPWVEVVTFGVILRAHVSKNQEGGISGTRSSRQLSRTAPLYRALALDPLGKAHDVIGLVHTNVSGFLLYGPEHGCQTLVRTALTRLGRTRLALRL